ncbi:MAG: TauD/TfdA family dioxygenase, partial [Gammaproteobacteria bacterium]|nr:TauD/TfdA family dioxygenase [Gammaproteobacteria bacterium]
GQACGASVSGINLAIPLSEHTVTELRQAWLEHQVLAFPAQSISTADLERFTRYFGPFGHDPFIEPIPGHPHVLAVERAADERGPVFAGNVFHTDWSFQETPPAGTCLYSITIPPVGGDTLFANQHMALESMPATLRRRIEGKVALHSAVHGYSKEGVYGENDAARSMSMKFNPGDEAKRVQAHPLIRQHPETGKPAIYGCFGYIIGIEGMAEPDAMELLGELHAWQTREEFQYRHKWSANMLVMWDNRSLLHAAEGGYDGHARLLHRTTIAERPS